MRLLVRQDEAQSGERLMAEDRDLLERAERGEIEPMVRFYEWSVPTLSLGYHQSADVLDDARLQSAGVPWVRRPTGGAAVLHSEELTYAVVVPDVAGCGGAARAQRLVAQALAQGLRAVGVEAELNERGEPLSSLPDRTSCFVRTSRWEVSAGGRKLVGSAQRKLTRALLQHGSILVGEDHLRIVEFLRLVDEHSRETLRNRLRERSTCITHELGHPVSMTSLRHELAEAFVRVFAAARQEVDGAAAS